MTVAVMEDVVVEGRECQWPVEKLPPNTQMKLTNAGGDSRFMHMATSLKTPISRSWLGVRSQLICRVVRQPPDRRDREPIEVGYLAREPSRANQRDVNKDANHE